MFHILLFKMRCQYKQMVRRQSFIRLKNKDKLWRERLGHISKTKFAHLKAKVLAEDSNYLNDVNPLESLCESCINGKQTRLPFAKESLCESCINGKQTQLPFAKVKDKIHIQRPLYIVHSDVGMWADNSTHN
jgi:hypothetical protein